MRCWTFASALALLAIGAADAQAACDSNVLVDAYEGLNVNDQLVSCMTQNNFSAALDGSVDLTSVDAGSTQEQITTICQSDACLTVISALIDSSNFNLTNCTVGDGIVLMDELNNLNAACDVIVAEGSSASDEGSASADSSYSTEGSSSQATTEGSSSASTSETVTTPAPETTAPETTAPETTTPETTAPETTTPETTTPEATTATPATETPATETPATEAPATETPATETPATETPATETPTTETPSTSTTETTSPATSTPETSTPETTTTPETTAPSSSDVTQETTSSPSTDSFSILDSDSGSTAGMQYRVEAGLCAKDGDATRALELYARMKTEGVNVSPYIYHVVINVCSKAEDPVAFKAGAFKVYEDMKQRGSASKHMVEESTYSALIKLCSKDQDFEACTELLAAMEAEAVAPKLRTFTPLLLAYSEVGNLDKCVWVHE
ncbi:hypothetical protein BBJ28_00022623, partial [Nothophytophthora sp. Chile5]